MHVAVDDENSIRGRSSALALDKFKFRGSDNELHTPRWVGTFILGEEYTIYGSPTIVFRLMLKLRTHYANRNMVRDGSFTFFVGLQC